jgi:hypothetical protein
MEQVEKGTSPAPLEEKAEGIYTSQATLTIAPPPFTAQFLDKSPEASAARAIYLKMLFAGVGALAVVIFAIFSIYWGSVWSTPHHTLPGWIVVSLQCVLVGSH